MVTGEQPIHAYGGRDGHDHLIVEVVVVMKVALGVFEAFFGGLTSRRYSTKLCCGLLIFHYHCLAIDQNGSTLHSRRANSKHDHA